ADCASCGAGRDVGVIGIALEVCEAFPVCAALLGATAAFGAGAAGRGACGLTGAPGRETAAPARAAAAAATGCGGADLLGADTGGLSAGADEALAAGGTLGAD